MRDYPIGSRISIRKLELESPKGVATLKIEYHVMAPAEDESDKNEVVYESGSLIFPLIRVVNENSLDIDKTKVLLDTITNEIKIFAERTLGFSK